MSVQKTIATTDHHPIAWFSELQRREKNTFWADMRISRRHGVWV